LRFTKNRQLMVKVSILFLILVVGVLLVSSCVQGLTPMGWAGVAVSDGMVVTGTKEGRAVEVKTGGSNPPMWAEPLTAQSSGGGFGCGSPASAVAIYGTPSLWNDLTFTAGYNGKIVAYNTNTLQSRWVYPREGYLKPIVSGTAVLGTTLFFADTDGKVYALDTATGDLKWQVQAGNQIWSTPSADGNMVFIGSFDKNLYALDASNGGKKWEYTTDGVIQSAPMVTGNVVYFSSLDRNLYAVSETSGTLKWKFQAANWFWAKPVLYNGNIYAPCLDNFIYVLDAATGEKKNAIDMTEPVSSSPVVVGSSLIVLAHSGKMYSIDTASGEKKLLTTLVENVTSPLAAIGDTVYVNAPDLNLYQVNAVSGAKTSISLKKPSG
jgi:eukaryotic-like serine/threonine-protein kinase